MTWFPLLPWSLLPGAFVLEVACAVVVVVVVPVPAPRPWRFILITVAAVHAPSASP